MLQSIATLAPVENTIDTIKNHTVEPVETVEDQILTELIEYPEMRAFLLNNGDVFAKVTDTTLHIYKAVVVSHAGVTVEGHNQTLPFNTLGKVRLLEHRGESSKGNDMYGRPVSAETSTELSLVAA